MGSCIICGASVDGHVCASHEEDVSFEFRGDRPDQLTPGRFYRGTVDGFADFGVFVDIGDHVTGLLHTSELDRRLESLDWEPGEPVYVRVKAVHDNGNVDLGWSIRQHASEFRGTLIDTPEGDQLPEGTPERSERRPPASTPAPTDSGRGNQGGSGQQAVVPSEPEGEHQSTGAATTPSTDEAGGDATRERASVETLGDRVGAPVRLEGWIVDVRQTSGPTVFELRDETGVVECAAFESAGVRAYPEIGVGDIVRLDGIVEEHRGDVQVETDTLAALDEEERAAVERRLDDALAERASPPQTEPLVDHPAIGSATGITGAATAIRRAVFEGRAVIIRHPATVDGHVAGAALERATVDLIEEEHAEADAQFRYVHRRPLDGPVYGMRDAVRDVTRMLEARERHGDAIPLFVFAGAGATADSRDAMELLGTYGAGRVVVAGRHPGDGADDAVDVVAAPAADVEAVTATAVCAEVAAAVRPAVRESLLHLPAVSYPRQPPAPYVELAAEAGYGAADVERLREAVALEAFYLTYEDKRELIADLLFDGGDLVARASERFRDRLETELRTATPHLDQRSVGGHRIGVLDVTAFTHRYDFPPTELLLVRLADAEGLDAIVGVGEDRLYVHGDRSLRLESIAAALDDAVPDAGIDPRGGGEGGIAFLSGERDAVTDAAVDAVAEALT